MSEFSPPEMHALPASGGDWRIYRGNSMLRVFAPGDLLQLEPLAAAQAEPGDVIAFDAPHGVAVVHRLIGRAPDGRLRTMGDNNPLPDAGTIPPDAAVFRVVAIREADGTLRPVARGAAGLAEFRRNRRNRWWHAELPRMLAGICRRLWCFKRTLNDPVRFGDEEIFYAGRTPVARRGGDRCVRWTSPWYRVVYRIGER